MKARDSTAINRVERALAIGQPMNPNCRGQTSAYKTPVCTTRPSKVIKVTGNTTRCTCKYFFAVSKTTIEGNDKEKYLIYSLANRATSGSCFRAISIGYIFPHVLC